MSRSRAGSSSFEDNHRSPERTGSVARSLLTPCRSARLRLWARKAPETQRKEAAALAPSTHLSPANGCPVVQAQSRPLRTQVQVETRLRSPRDQKINPAAPRAPGGWLPLPHPTPSSLELFFDFQTGWSVKPIKRPVPINKQAAVNLPLPAPRPPDTGRRSQRAGLSGIVPGN